MEKKPRKKNNISSTKLNNLITLDPTLSRIIRLRELGKEKIMQFTVPTDLEEKRTQSRYLEEYLEGERTQFFSPARCIPSRAMLKRVSEYQKKMIAKRGKFIDKYPILNPAPPEK